MAASVMLGAFSAAAAAQSVTLDQAMEKMRAALASIPHVSHTDLVSDETGPRYRAARDFIREQQCMAKSANPLLALALPASLRLRGTLDSTQTPRVAETFELPLRLAALADLPNEYSKHAEGSQQPQNHALLTARVASLMESFELSKCRASADDRASTPRNRFIFIAPTF